MGCPEGICTRCLLAVLDAALAESASSSAFILPKAPQPPPAHAPSYSPTPPAPVVSSPAPLEPPSLAPTALPCTPTYDTDDDWEENACLQQLSPTSQRHIAHLANLILHGKAITEDSLPLPARIVRAVWTPGVKHHTEGRTGSSTACHLIRIFLDHFRRTSAFQERIVAPVPWLLRDDNKFINLHAKPICKAAGGNIMSLPVHSRLQVLDAYVRRTFAWVLVRRRSRAGREWNHVPVRNTDGAS